MKFSSYVTHFARWDLISRHASQRHCWAPVPGSVIVPNVSVSCVVVEAQWWTTLVNFTSILWIDFCQFSFEKNYKPKYCWHIKASKKIWDKKAAHKMLVKLTHVVYFANILQSDFLPIFFWKITNPNWKRRWAAQNTFIQKSCS